ncbi:MAG: shikimate kinase [Rhodospirillales bacterium]
MADRQSCKSSGRASDRRSIVLVGHMGAGKSSIGRRLAKCLNMPFRDADDEIVRAAGCSVEDIFSLYGEQAFRDGERKVIMRLLDGKPIVLATGGGAFMDETLREKIAACGISVWLRVGLDMLVARTEHREGRPLLKNKDVRTTLQALMDQRDPVYALADLTVDAKGDSPEETAEHVHNAIGRYLERKTAS